MFHFIYSIIIVLCISVSCVHDSKDQMMNEPSTATASSSALPDATSSENQSFLLCVGCGSNYSPTAADFYRFPANDGGNNSSHGACFRCLQQRYQEFKYDEHTQNCHFYSSQYQHRNDKKSCKDCDDRISCIACRACKECKKKCSSLSLIRVFFQPVIDKCDNQPVETIKEYLKERLNYNPLTLVGPETSFNLVGPENYFKLGNSENYFKFIKCKNIFQVFLYMIEKELAIDNKDGLKYIPIIAYFLENGYPIPWDWTSVASLAKLILLDDSDQFLHLLIAHGLDLNKSICNSATTVSMILDVIEDHIVKNKKDYTTYCERFKDLLDICIENGLNINNEGLWNIPCVSIISKWYNCYQDDEPRLFDTIQSMTDIVYHPDYGKKVYCDDLGVNDHFPKNHSVSNLLYRFLDIMSYLYFPESIKKNATEEQMEKTFVHLLELFINRSEREGYKKEYLNTAHSSYALGHYIGNEDSPLAVLLNKILSVENTSKHFYSFCLELMQILLRHGADVNTLCTSFPRSSPDCTLLYAAIHHRNIPLTKLLLEHGARLADTSRFNWIKNETPLHAAVRNNDLPMVSFLYEHNYLSKELLHKANEKNETPLSIAKNAMQINPPLVALLDSIDSQ